MGRALSWPVCLLVGAALAVACAEGRDPDGAGVEVERCGECHERPGGVAIPPPPHGAHPYDCSVCHEVPDEVLAEGHLEDRGVEDVVFGGLAVAEGATPEWDGTRCSNVYCHGATLPGGEIPAPEWATREESLGCDACHASPPPPPHPENDDCALCHGASVTDAGIPRKQRHPNGVVEFNEGGTPTDLPCGACHGVPPEEPHPQIDDCTICHAPAFDEDGDLDPNVHLNGQVELGGGI